MRSGTAAAAHCTPWTPDHGPADPVTTFPVTSFPVTPLPVTSFLVTPSPSRRLPRRFPPLRTLSFRNALPLPRRPPRISRDGGANYRFVYLCVRIGVIYLRTICSFCEIIDRIILRMSIFTQDSLLVPACTFVHHIITEKCYFLHRRFPQKWIDGPVTVRLDGSTFSIARIGSPESGFEKGRNTNLFL